MDTEAMDVDTHFAAPKKRVESWLVTLVARANATVDAIQVPKRERVHEYLLPLRGWHRLDIDRWEASRITPRAEGTKAKASLDVDYLVACAYWKDQAGLGVPQRSRTWCPSPSRAEPHA